MLPLGAPTDMEHSHWGGQAYEWDPAGLVAGPMAAAPAPSENVEGVTADGQANSLVSPKKRKLRNGPLVCRVKDCGKSLLDEKTYCQHNRVCKMHVLMPALDIDGSGLQRFCHKCSKFRPVGDFEGSRRNCRPCLATLRKQNALRQKNKYRSPAASSGDGGGAQNNSSELKSSSSAEAHPHHSSKSNSPKSPQGAASGQDAGSAKEEASYFINAGPMFNFAAMAGGQAGASVPGPGQSGAEPSSLPGSSQTQAGAMAGAQQAVAPQLNASMPFWAVSMPSAATSMPFQAAGMPLGAAGADPTPTTAAAAASSWPALMPLPAQHGFHLGGFPLPPVQLRIPPASTAHTAGGMAAAAPGSGALEPAAMSPPALQPPAPQPPPESGIYKAEDIAMRLSFKIDCTPDQLPPDLYAELISALQRVEGLLACGYLRPGCTHLLLDLSLPASSHPSLLDLPSGLQLEEALQQLLPLQALTEHLCNAMPEATVTVQAGGVLQSYSASASPAPRAMPEGIMPTLDRASSACALQPDGTTRLLLRGRGLRAPGNIFLVRQAGAYKPCSVVPPQPSANAGGSKAAPQPHANDADDAPLELLVSGLHSPGLLCVEVERGDVLTAWRPVLLLDDPALLADILRAEQRAQDGAMNPRSLHDLLVDFGRVLDAAHAPREEEGQKLQAASVPAPAVGQDPMLDSDELPRVEQGREEEIEDSANECVVELLPAELDLRGERDPEAVVDEGVTGFYCRVLRSGCHALGFCARAGLAAAASWLLGALIANVPASDLLALAAGPKGPSLLHKCILSGCPDMVAAALSWQELSWDWCAEAACHDGMRTPLHVAAGLHDGGAAARSILGNVPAAAVLWTSLPCGRDERCTPAAVAAALGRHTLNQFAAAALRATSGAAAPPAQPPPYDSANAWPESGRAADTAAMATDAKSGDAKQEQAEDDGKGGGAGGGYASMLQQLMGLRRIIGTQQQQQQPLQAPSGVEGKRRGAGVAAARLNDDDSAQAWTQRGMAADKDGNRGNGEPDSHGSGYSGSGGGGSSNDAKYSSMLRQLLSMGHITGTAAQQQS